MTDMVATIGILPATDTLPEVGYSYFLLDITVNCFVSCLFIGDGGGTVGVTETNFLLLFFVGITAVILFFLPCFLLFLGLYIHEQSNNISNDAP